MTSNEYDMIRKVVRCWCHDMRTEDLEDLIHDVVLYRLERGKKQWIKFSIIDVLRKRYGRVGSMYYELRRNLIFTMELK